MPPAVTADEGEEESVVQIQLLVLPLDALLFLAPPKLISSCKDNSLASSCDLEPHNH